MSFVISCEEDFTDIESGVVSNTKFDTNSLSIGVELKNSNINSVVTYNGSVRPNISLLGVHATGSYETLKASIVSQVGISPGLQVIDNANVYGSDTLVVTTIDTVFVKLPYQVTLNEAGTAYELDSIIGDTSKAFNLNVYESDIYFSDLDPVETNKKRVYNSNDPFIPETPGDRLNAIKDFKFIPKLTDTIFIKRRLNDEKRYTIDTVSYLGNASTTLSVPFAVVPLKEDKIKELFLDQYKSGSFASQAAFNNYFKGIILEATGNEGSLISFNFANPTVNPSIEVYYTNTVLTGGTVIDSIRKNDSFPLSGIRASIYDMPEKMYPVNSDVIVQGAAGSEVLVSLFGADDILSATKINELRAQNLLVNDASLTFYINQAADTTAIPYRLFLYKQNGANSFSHVKDAFSEGLASFGGSLARNSASGKLEKYTFRITDYVSDILNGETSYSPKLRLKVSNLTDFLTVTDTIYKNYNWNPKAITLLNHLSMDENKKPTLKISYTKEKD